MSQVVHVEIHGQRYAVRSDLDAMQEMVQMNSQATPTTVIDGEVIIGFDKDRISEKLGL